MAYESSVWLGCVAALCPSEDGDNDGTTTVKDFSLVSNATLTNMDAATDWVTDDGKRALDFDGSNDYVVTGATPMGGLKSCGIAVKFRRLATTGNGVFLSLSNTLGANTNRLIVYHFSDGNLYIQFPLSVYGYFAFNLTDLDWHSLVINFDGGESGNSNRLRAWLDGTQKTLTFVGTIPASLAISDCRLHLGAVSDSSPIYGRSRMDDIRINARIFTEAERTEIDTARGSTYAEASGGGAFSLIGAGGLVF